MAYNSEPHTNAQDGADPRLNLVYRAMLAKVLALNPRATKEEVDAAESAAWDITLNEMARWEGNPPLDIAKRVTIYLDQPNDGLPEV